jgi:excisionase family DNA binding protein
VGAADGVVSVLEDTIREIVRETVRETVREELAQRAPSGWLSVKSAAAYLDTTEDAIYAMVRRGDLVPHRTPTGRLRFRVADLDAWVRGGGS